MHELTEPPRAGVWLQTLGAFRALDCTGEIDVFATRRQRAAVLLYLVIEGEVTRDRLLAMFWPDQDRERSRRALNQTLYMVRQVLGHDCIETVGDRLRAASWIDSDAGRFTRSLAAGARDDALTLYTGPFLAGTELARTQEFLAWTDVQRARLDRLHRSARRDQIADLVRAARLDEALASARAWVALDPADDEAEHRRIQLLAEAGLRTEALRQYQAYERLLAGDQLEPLDETRELVAQLRAGEVAPLPRLPPPTEPPESLTAAATADLQVDVGAAQAAAAQQPGAAPQAAVTASDTAHEVAPCGDAAAVRDGPADTMRTALAAHRSVLGGIVLASAVVVVILALLFARDVASGEPDPREVAVWPFRVDGDPALVYLATGVADLMAARLHERAGLHATPPADLRRAMARADTRPVSDTAAARMALGLGAGIVVTGEITGSRDDLRVRARLRHSTGGDPPIEREATGSLGDLPILVDRLASDLARAAAARRRTYGS